MFGFAFMKAYKSYLNHITIIYTNLFRDPQRATLAGGAAFETKKKGCVDADNYKTNLRLGNQPKNNPPHGSGPQIWLLFQNFKFFLTS